MPAYRLQVLLDIRAKAEDAAKEAYSQALQAREAEARKARELAEALERRRAERKAKVQAFLEEVTEKGGGIAGFQQMSRFEQRLKDEEAEAEAALAVQHQVVAEAGRLVDQRRAELAEAAKERLAIEKHKETWQGEVRRQRQQREELVQEEIGNTLHLARARAGKKA
jgi:hypothetical protein